MKMKDDSQGYNNVSVLEIEARFPGLIEILVNKLENNVEAKSCLIEPCVVPILTILSRMETNISNSLSELINKCIRRFSGSPVMAVRKLVAKTHSQLCPKTAQEIADDVLSKLSQGKDFPTNDLHSDILLILNIVEKTRYDAPEQLIETLKKIDEMLHCYVVKCEIVKITKALVKKGASEIRLYGCETYTCEPGLHIWKQQIGDAILSAEELDSNNPGDQISKVIGTADIEKALTLLEKILSDESIIVTGGDIEKLLDFFLSKKSINQLNPESNNQLFNSEFALDLLEIIEDEKLNNFGVTVFSKVVNLKAVCLNIMLIQEDWEWFFGDTSEYVSKVVENSEQIQKLAGPENIETSRILAAKSIKSYLECFQLKRIKKMALVLQFGFANLLNSSCVLLQDEDVEVREVAMEFANNLPRPDFSSSHVNVGRLECVRRVVWCGLDQLLEVVDMLTPVIQGIILPSQLSIDFLDQKKDASSSLFRRGEGLNVFIENFYEVFTYQEAVRDFLKHKDVNFNLNLNTLTVQTTTKEFLMKLSSQERNIFKSTSSKNGFEKLSTFHGLVTLLANYHQKIVKSEQDTIDFVTLEQLFQSHSLFFKFL